MHLRISFIQYLSYFLLFISYYFLPSKSLGQIKPEFRGVWIATVDNIDWPSAGNYDSGLQKEEFISLLDLHKKNGMNAVVVQIRPAADAFYPSPYEPWSQWLTGKQGKAPSPYYDPLEFMITETHKRGMEFHAWMNPYRAVFNIRQSSIAATHITRIHPDWFLAYGDKKYFDPSSKEVQQYVCNVVKDVVSRYKVDAIHFDDYFYPYKISGKEFPDRMQYQKLGKGMSKDKWRRSNVDSIISLLSKTIKKENPNCRFGISPFGVWRNSDKDSTGSNTRAGQTNYDDLYADILLWLKKDWIDYVAPQLYWEIGFKLAPYEVLLDWWGKHTFGKHCYIGLGIYRANSNKAWKNKSQIPGQIKMLRNTSNVHGMIFYSSNTFEKNPNGWNDSLRYNYFKHPTIIPEMKWIDAKRPEAPEINSVAIQKKEGLFIVQGELLKPNLDIRKIVVYIYADDKKTSIEKIYHFTLTDKKFNLSFPINSNHTTKSFGLTTVSNNNVESRLKIFNWKE